MAGDNKVEQKIGLDTSEYVEGLNRARAAAKSSMGGVDKTLHESGSAFGDYTTKVKKNLNSFESQLEAASKRIASFFSAATLFGAAAKVGSSIAQGGMDAVHEELGLSRDMAGLRARAGLTGEQTDRIESQIGTVAADTGANSGEVSRVFTEAFMRNKNADESIKFANAIAKAAKTQHEDPVALGRTVIERLAGTGRPITADEAEKVTHGARVGTRHGTMEHESDVIGAVNEIGPQVAQRTKLSDTELGTDIAAVGSAGKEALKAYQALAQRTDESRFGGRQVVESELGTKFRGESGNEKFSIDKLLERLPKIISEQGGEQGAKAYFNQVAGFSDEESEGLLEMNRKREQILAREREGRADRSTDEGAYREGTANFLDKWDRVREQGLNIGRSAFGAVTGGGSSSPPPVDAGTVAAELAKALTAHAKGGEQRVHVTVDSKDPGFTARPKSSDYPRNPHGP
jgi:hypothetical protein